MRVARTVAPGDTRIEHVPDPEAGAGEVVCRVLACATCGSDVQDWYVARKLPAVLGHEPAGEVVAVGPGVERVNPGDRVAIHHHAPCGDCDRCARGHETLCERFRSTRLDPGGFAEMVRIERDLVGELLPIDGMDPVLATFTEPLGCVLRAQDRARLAPGDSLLVVGAGASGLLQIAAARARGVTDIRVLEPRYDRYELARSWGASAHEGDAVDVAIACTPAPAAIAVAADALGAGGRLCVYAPPQPGAPLAVDGAEVFLRELTIASSWSAGPGDMRASLELLRTGAVEPLELVQMRVPLDRTGEALAAQRSGAALKAVVLP